MASSAAAAADEKPHFVCPTIVDNPDGWGPFTVPEKFKDTPYQPFSKSDKIGKVWASCLPRRRSRT